MTWCLMDFASVDTYELLIILGQTVYYARVFLRSVLIESGPAKTCYAYQPKNAFGLKKKKF